MAKRGDEKREHQRVEARLAMQLAEEAHGAALVTTESLNISRGGVYCESPEYMAPLSKVGLTVVLPAAGRGAAPRMLRCEGVVVRCEALPPVRGRKRYQLACCFTGLDPEGRALLDEFVSWRALRGRTAAARPPARASRRAASPARRKPPTGKATTRKAATRKSATRKTAARKTTARKATSRRPSGGGRKRS